MKLFFGTYIFLILYLTIVISTKSTDAIFVYQKQQGITEATGMFTLSSIGDYMQQTEEIEARGEYWNNPIQASLVRIHILGDCYRFGTVNSVYNSTEQYFDIPVSLFINNQFVQVLTYIPAGQCNFEVRNLDRIRIPISSSSVFSIAFDLTSRVNGQFGNFIFTMVFKEDREFR